MLRYVYSFKVSHKIAHESLVFLGRDEGFYVYRVAHPSLKEIKEKIDHIKTIEYYHQVYTNRISSLERDIIDANKRKALMD